MSKLSPRYFMLIVEHSMCHPGLPLPQGLSQNGSPGLAAFQSAKSSGSSLSSLMSIRVPASMSSGSLRESLPYPLNFFTEKKTSPPDV